MWVYGGFNASGDLWFSVYTGLNAFAKKINACTHTHTNRIRVSNGPLDVQIICFWEKNVLFIKSIKKKQRSTYCTSNRSINLTTKPAVPTECDNIF